MDELLMFMTRRTRDGAPEDLFRAPKKRTRLALAFGRDKSAADRPRVRQIMNIKTSSRYPMKFVALTLLAAAAAACQTSGLPVQIAMSPEAPFARYHTFSFGAADGAPVGSYLPARSWDVHNRLRPLVGAALARKGYVEDIGKADFVVRLGAGTVDLPDMPVDEDVINDATTGQLAPSLSVAIDMYDAATGARVWHGATVVALKGGRSDDNLLERIVTSAFAAFPHASKSG